MSIGEFLEIINPIKRAVHGIEMRQAIYNGFKKAYEDAAAEHDNTNMEVKLARGTYRTLGSRLDDEHKEVHENLQEKADKDDVQNLLDGAPKEFFNTLSELQLKYPEGAEGVFVVKSDLYYWEGAAWRLGGEYQAALSSFKNMWENSDVETAFNTKSNQIARLHIKPRDNWNAWHGHSPSAQQLNVIKGHRYYAKVKVKQSVAEFNNDIRLYYEDESYTEAEVINSEPTRVAGIIVAEQTGNASVVFSNRPISQEGTLQRVNQILVNLSDLFGVGFEPSLDEFEKIISEFPNSWFDTKTQFNTVQKYMMRLYIRGLQKEESSSPLLPKRNQDKHLLWFDTKKKIVYAADNVLPINRDTLYASYDYGNNWKVVYNAISGISVMKTLESGFHLIRDSATGKVQRVSPDFGNGKYPEEPEGIMRQPINSDNGIAESEGVILYAEYSALPDTVNKLYKSVDDGISWQVSHDGAGVRHWHSVQVDPYTGYFWACSGDSDDESMIIMSSDGGTTWNIMAQGTQKVRAVGLAFTDEYVYWGMDSTVSPKIYKAKKIILL